MEDFIEDKLSLILFQGLHQSLDNMSALRILSEQNDFPIESIRDEFNLLRHVSNVEHCLDSVSACLVAANLYESRLDGLQNGKSLAACAVCEELLDEIVPIMVNHELRYVIDYLLQEEGDYRRGTFNEVLLKEPAACLT